MPTSRPQDPKHTEFVAHYHGKGKKAELSSQADVDAVIAETKDAVFSVKSVKPDG